MRSIRYVRWWETPNKLQVARPEDLKMCLQFKPNPTGTALYLAATSTRPSTTRGSYPTSSPTHPNYNANYNTTRLQRHPSKDQPSSNFSCNSDRTKPNSNTSYSYSISNSSSICNFYSNSISKFNFSPHSTSLNYRETVIKVHVDTRSTPTPTRLFPNRIHLNPTAFI